MAKKEIDSESCELKLGEEVDLSKWDPDDTSTFQGDKKDAVEKIEELRLSLEKLQELLYAEHKHKLLIVLQGVDTSGKDSTIRAVFSGVNPQGVRVHSFKQPTPEEKDHDFLWRVHKQVPQNGEIVIFNRSHYESVLVEKVHNLAPKEEEKKRYEEINDFERLLHNEGTTILKFFLYISKDAQKKKLMERLEDPTKEWKFSAADLPERKYWSEYVKAYEKLLEKTNTAWAMWRIVPSNHKWFRDLIVVNAIVDELEKLNMQYPKLATDDRKAAEDSLRE
jgi:PPK2 family polyphosphate:nucleotide phosphotransferase